MNIVEQYKHIEKYGNLYKLNILILCIYLCVVKGLAYRPSWSAKTTPARILDAKPPRNDPHTPADPLTQPTNHQTTHPRTHPHPQMATVEFAASDK